MSQIELEQVCKSFTLRKRQKGWLGAVRGAFTRDTQTIRAVDNVSFTVDEGELVGYIGPNGAGKSTTIKMMSGILTPDSGRVSVMGRVPWRERVRHVASIGVVFGQRSQLWWDTPVIDSFELLRDIYRVSPTDYRRRLDDLTALLDATSLLNTPVRQLSLGQRMKCEFIGALLHGSGSSAILGKSGSRAAMGRLMMGSLVVSRAKKASLAQRISPEPGSKMTFGMGASL